jgi:hypothetical protein
MLPRSNIIGFSFDSKLVLSSSAVIVRILFVVSRLDINSISEEEYLDSMISLQSTASISDWVAKL